MTPLIFFLLHVSDTATDFVERTADQRLRKPSKGTFAGYLGESLQIP